ncbi:MAG: nuclear transport factor 2 family protein [Alphaproteobacteria bacterium]|nr:nuclear transport factor 2 family protein [Alphaproteobacteria bacterium]
MPAPDRVRALIASVEAGDYVQAIEDFYHEDAMMQENEHKPRAGRAALVAFEQRTLEQVSMRTRTVERFAIEGDTVFINWVFEATGPDGATRILDEIAVQTWRGDRIAAERFYYDPQR